MDQPSQTMWCMPRQRTCSSSASRTSAARSSGPVRRSNGSPAMASKWAATRSASTSDSSGSTGVAGCTIWTPQPCSSANVVRRISCRSTTDVRAALSASTSGFPVSRTANAELYSVASGAKLWTNQSRCWPNDIGGLRPRCGVTTSTAAGASCTTRASLPIVGWSNSARGESSARSTVRIRDATRRVRIESPPSAKKSSCVPM